MPAQHIQITADVACTVCGCLCDDLRVTVDAGRVVAVERACQLAEPWFFSQSSHQRPAAEIGGRACDLAEAVRRAAEILSRADAPLIYGLSRSSTEGQRAAVQLADRIGATVDTTASLCHGPSIMALQEVGESTCTLGEIRNRADLLIFWGCNPAATHPRHAERYSVFPKGQFVPGGRRDRTVVMIGDAREVHEWRLDAHGARPDIVIPIEPGADFNAVTSLRALVKGVPLAGREGRLGADQRRLTDLVHRMRACQCGVFFFGLGLTGTGGAPQERDMLGHLNVAALLRLTAELNAVTRFHARRMRLHGDVSGADSVLCWQTGFPFSVNLARDFPRYNPGEFSADVLLSRGEADACVIVGSETLRQFSPASLDHLRRIPSIVLDYPAIEPPFPPTIRITTAPYGLYAAGTAYRMDEVPIGLRKCLDADWPTDADVLTQMASGIWRAGDVNPPITRQ